MKKLDLKWKNVPDFSNSLHIAEIQVITSEAGLAQLAQLASSISKLVGILNNFLGYFSNNNAHFYNSVCSYLHFAVSTMRATEI